MTAPIRFLPAAAAASLSADAAGRGLPIHAIDGAAVRDAAGLLRSLGAALSFPAYYGNNWDAAEECLRDLTDHHPRGSLLLIENARDLWRRLPREMGLLLSLWLDIGENTKASWQLVFLVEEDSDSSPIKSPSPPAGGRGPG
jgi:hypothetical protein